MNGHRNIMFLYKNSFIRDLNIIDIQVSTLYETWNKTNNLQLLQTNTEYEYEI